jgi:hypothetical protein
LTGQRIACDYRAVAVRRLGCVLFTEDLAAEIVATDAVVRAGLLLPWRVNSLPVAWAAIQASFLRFLIELRCFAGRDGPQFRQE